VGAQQGAEIADHGSCSGQDCPDGAEEALA
jgi:hypothetical protein